jgi:uncharacterized membrane protein
MTETVSPDVADLPGASTMEMWISRVLRVGVITSAIIILTGVVIFLVHGPGPAEAHSKNELLAGGGSQISTSLHSIAHGVAHGDAYSIIELGLLVLILTPTVRVAMTAVLFIRQQDWIFVAITSVVLFILVLGLIGFGS